MGPSIKYVRTWGGGQTKSVLVCMGGGGVKHKKCLKYVRTWGGGGQTKSVLVCMGGGGVKHKKYIRKKRKI